MTHPRICAPAVIQPSPLVLDAVDGPFPLSMQWERSTRDVWVRIRARVKDGEAHQRRNDKRTCDAERSVVEHEPPKVVAVGAKRLVSRLNASRSIHADPPTVASRIREQPAFGGHRTTAM
jgi:hypothetical protein